MLQKLQKHRAAQATEERDHTARYRELIGLPKLTGKQDDELSETIIALGFSDEQVDSDRRAMLAYRATQAEVAALTAELEQQAKAAADADARIEAGRGYKGFGPAPAFGASSAELLDRTAALMSEDGARRRLADLAASMQATRWNNPRLFDDAIQRPQVQAATTRPGTHIDRAKFLEQRPKPEPTPPPYTQVKSITTAGAAVAQPMTISEVRQAMNDEVRRQAAVEARELVAGLNGLDGAFRENLAALGSGGDLVPVGVGAGTVSVNER